MNKRLLAMLVACTLPAIAAAEMKMQNSDPSSSTVVVPEHVTQNSNPSPDSAPEHVMQNSNPSASPASSSDATVEQESLDIQHLMKKK